MTTMGEQEIEKFLRDQFFGAPTLQEAVDEIVAKWVGDREDAEDESYLRGIRVALEGGL